MLVKQGGTVVAGKLRYRIFGGGATAHWPMAMRTFVGN
jgi:hypothetical protein